MRPLRGLTVVDISRLLPGGVASLLLAEAGACVIKVEQPGVGDYYRALFGGAGFIGSGQFAVVNQGKEGLALDLKRPQGKEIFEKLVRLADVVIENFRPGTLKRLGLDFNRLKRINRRLILCSITGAGRKGGRSHLAGHDLNYLALSGLLAMMKDGEGRPVIPDFQIIDLVVGYEAAQKISTALFERERTRRGSWVEASMLGTGLQLARFYAGEGSRFGRPMLSGQWARYGVYRTRDDRAVALAALEPKFWSQFARFVGRPEWEGLTDNAEALREIFRGRTLEEWEEVGRKNDFCLTPVRELAEVPLPRPRRAPRLGEQTGRILRGLGYSPAAIRRLKEEKVIA